MPTILFVEDDPAAARSLRFVRANADHEVEWIATGGEGLNCFDALRPDLLVLDVSLPDVSDYEICAEIGRRSQTPIRFVFAHVHDDDIIRGFQAGADDYITKPFSPRALAVRIEALLRRARYRVEPQSRPRPSKTAEPRRSAPLLRNGNQRSSE